MYIQAKTYAKIGQKFGRLLCVSVEKDKNTAKTLGIFQCDCGAIYKGTASSVFSGNTKSCGCANKDALLKRNMKHGKASSRLYWVWSDMVRRCTNPNHARWADYGGRGVSVDARWLKFENFYTDMGDCPSGMSLDRIDNNLGYSRENCRWADAYQQAANKRNNRHLTAFGRTLLISWWAQLIVMGSSDLGKRLSKGNNLEDIIVGRVGIEGANYIWSHS